MFHDDMLGKSACGSALREKKGINTKERTNLCVRNTSTGSPYNNFPSMYYVQRGSVESFRLDVDLLAGKLNLVGKFFKKSKHREK